MRLEDTHSVKNIVDNALKKSRLLKQGMIQGNWSKIIGKELAKKSYAAMVKNRILVIHTENSVWLQQFSFMKREIVERVNEFLEMDYISDIQLKVAPMDISDYFQGEEEEKKFNPDEVIIDQESTEEIESISNEIEDDEIKDRIKKLMTLSKKKEKFLLEEGNSKCIDCGVVFKGKGRRCITCENKLRKQKLELVYDLIKSNPHIEYKHAQLVLSNLREGEFEDIKSKIKERCYIRMHNAINKDNIAEYKRIARLYFALETGVKKQDELEFIVNNYLLRME